MEFLRSTYHPDPSTSQTALGSVCSANGGYLITPLDFYTSLFPFATIQPYKPSSKASNLSVSAKEQIEAEPAAGAIDPPEKEPWGAVGNPIIMLEQRCTVGKNKARLKPWAMRKYKAREGTDKAYKVGDSISACSMRILFNDYSMVKTDNKGVIAAWKSADNVVNAYCSPLTYKGFKSCYHYEGNGFRSRLYHS